MKSSNVVGFTLVEGAVLGLAVIGAIEVAGYLVKLTAYTYRALQTRSAVKAKAVKVEQPLTTDQINAEIAAEKVRGEEPLCHCGPSVVLA